MAPDAAAVKRGPEVYEGWWHPNVKSGQVHDHTAVQPQTMHRLCERVYTRRGGTLKVYLIEISRRYEFYAVGSTPERAQEVALAALKRQVETDNNVDPGDVDYWLHLNHGVRDGDEADLEQTPYTVEDMTEYFGWMPMEIEIDSAVEYGTDRVLARLEEKGTDDTNDQG